MYEPYHHITLEFLCFSLQPTSLYSHSQTFPTHFDCVVHVINFTNDKNVRVCDTGQWQLRVSSLAGRVGAFERRYPHYPRGTSFCEVIIAMQLTKCQEIFCMLHLFLSMGYYVLLSCEQPQLLLLKWLFHCSCPDYLV
jgi:hypothetical protein